ncbi:MULTISPECIES: hypothetical protein [unclassified Streptomyces]|uniref:hypothetical protein n=1 Tax=unclassified Streptomyces TaxID=2593676 RepID=UPI0008DE799D|nr:MULTISPECIES: hypothetical protein [unclassified Streptomyces]OII66605.1 hypothetical protein BJP39_08320 [Streptomyces sp. CC77]
MKLKGALVAVAVAAVSGVGLAAPAHADAVPGWIADRENQESPEACKLPNHSDFDFTYYYNSGWKNAYRNIGYSVWNMADVRIGGAPQAGLQPLRYCGHIGPGVGMNVKNNAASAANRHSKYTAVSHFKSGYAGPQDRLVPGSRMYRLKNTYNENASFSWG